MMSQVVWALVLSQFFIVALLIFSFLRGKAENSSILLQSQMQSLANQVQSSMHQNSQILQKSQEMMGTRLDSTVKLMGHVQNQLGQLDQSAKRILEIGQDISNLQDILKAPKIRGSLGELFLGDLLAQLLPQDHFTLQHRFRSGERVDAAIKLMNGLVPVDSKFPLESFKVLQLSQTLEEQTRSKKLFVKAVKVHIDAIASKYILPEEGTFDFALMYIPAENVYYETIIRYEKDDNDLWQYALDKRVIPVSPNSFIAYLQSIVMGLKGLRLETGIKEMIGQLSGVKNDFAKFSEDYALVGTHLTRMQSSYQNSEKRLNKLSVKLENIELIDSQSQQKLPIEN